MDLVAQAGSKTYSIKLRKQHLEDPRNNSLVTLRRGLLKHGTWGTPHCISLSTSRLTKD